MSDSVDSIEELRVDLAALRRRGIDRHAIDVALPTQWLAAALADTDAEVDAPGRLSLDLLLQPQGVVVARGPLRVGFSVPCGRCLAPAAVNGDAEIFATFMPGQPIDDDEIDEDDLEPDADSPDLWRYEGGTLALGGLVAEQVALGYPMRALCAKGEACRGLCSNCGHELNTAPADARQCPSCGKPVPLTPVADLPSSSAAGSDGGPSGEGQRDDREIADNPLAAALSKLELD